MAGEKKGVKRKRVLPLPASYVEGEEEEEERSEPADLLPNHTEELESALLLAESDSKPKVKTKVETEVGADRSEPVTGAVQSPDCQLMEQRHIELVMDDTSRTVSETTCRDQVLLVNHLDSIAPSPPPLSPVASEPMRIEPDEPCSEKTEVDKKAVISDAPPTDEVMSAIANHVLPDETQTEDLASGSPSISGTHPPRTESESVSEESAPPVVPLEVNVDETAPARNSPGTDTSVESSVSPVVSPASNEATERISADATVTAAQVASFQDALAVKVKCEVEETLNDVKRDDFLTGKLGLDKGLT